MKHLTIEQTIKMIKGEDISEEDKVFLVELGLRQELKKARQADSYLTIKGLAGVLKEVLDKAEIISLIKELK